MNRGQTASLAPADAGPSGRLRALTGIVNRLQPFAIGTDDYCLKYFDATRWSPPIVGHSWCMGEVGGRGDFHTVDRLPESHL